MLARAFRLRTAADIARTYKKGAYGGGGPLSVKAAPSSRPASRAVVVVGKKVSKRATVRNRIRRRIIGHLADQWQTLATGYDIVVTVHADISEQSVPALQELVVRALTRAGVIKS
ncbi:MAG TPA: ribonuclease P protein component [Candidatus Saccharimonadia bacterium]|nr:ribonuclease P protein component [Candidatus Saccharimonadia bacterium]